jgi:hypothetical protein
LYRQFCFNRQGKRTRSHFALAAKADFFATEQWIDEEMIWKFNHLLIRLLHMIRILTIFVAAAILWPSFATAAPKPLIQNPKHWGAFELKEKAGKACYMVGKPVETAPKNVRRGDIWLLVTHRPAGKIKNEVQVIVGYTFKNGSAATITIDGKKFTLFTEKDAAWADSAKDDNKLVAAMRKGNNLIVRGVSSRGTKTTDRYNLSGFSAAHAAIGKACDVK